MHTHACVSWSLDHLSQMSIQANRILLTAQASASLTAPVLTSEESVQDYQEGIRHLATPPQQKNSVTSGCPLLASAILRPCNRCRWQLQPGQRSSSLPQNTCSHSCQEKDRLAIPVWHKPRDGCDKASALQWLNVPQAARLDMPLFGSECWSIRHCSCKPCASATMVPKLACASKAPSYVVLLNDTAD